MNIEKRTDRLYHGDFLHKWFAISSLLLFLFTVAMVFADYAREWKQYRREFDRMQIQRTRDDIGKAVSSIDRTKYQQLATQLQQARSDQKQNEAQVDQIQKKIDDIKAKKYAADQSYQFKKATYDTQKYEYEEAFAHKRSNADSLKATMDETQKQMLQFQSQSEQLKLDLDAANADLNKFVGKRDAAQKGLETMLTDYTRLETRLNALNPGLVITSFINAPVFDFMHPSEKVNQIILPNLFVEQPFKSVPRVDRCTTCHLGIDQKGYENAPQPFRTHPNMDLYLGSASAHPIDTFGCTSCHAGLDRATDFQRAGHMPKSEEQRAEWVKKYGWHEEEFLETPMLPMNRIEAGCYKCHSGSADVPQAAALDNGRDLIRIYGCFGCHKIPGYETVRKVGPDLSTVSGKVVSKDWALKWISNPRAFKSEARMPQFWGNSNNSGPEFEKRNATEMNAIIDYIWSKSKPNELPAGKTTGNAAKGKQLVESVGCFGCHSVGPIQEVNDRTQTRRKHGYNLASEGSKVSTSWLYNWVKDPQKVWHDTKMPMLRLSDDEAADIAAYLSTLKNPEFDAKQAPQMDPKSLDDIAMELLRNNSTEIEATENLKKMSADEKTLFVGQRLIGRYGCFGCHNIPGFENAQPIGTELTTEGSKLVSQLDFSFLPIEHSRSAWFTQKLKDPRIFDVGRVKKPEELLKMPNFKFSDSEINSIATVLVSLVKDSIAEEMRDPVTATIAEGREFIDEKNCKGCHIIEGMGGDIRALFKGTEMGLAPPNLNTEGLKTQPMWLQPFLLDPGKEKLRPWLSLRMPTFHFTEKETDIIGRYFTALDKADYPFISTAVEATPQQLQAGAKLFDEVKCASCHPTGNVTPPGKGPDELAPNLALAHERLRPEWIALWLKNPNAIAPGTKMPGFFVDGNGNFTEKSVLPDLNGNSTAQIEALRDHVFLAISGGGGAKRATTATANKN